jgi:hypothetical protein
MGMLEGAKKSVEAQMGGSAPVGALRFSQRGR